MPTFCPNLIRNLLHCLRLGISMRRYQPNPRGRFVRAHLRRSPTNPHDYFNVVDYQEKVDRLRARLKQLAELQLKFQFLMPQQSEQVDSNNHDSNGPRG